MNEYYIKNIDENELYKHLVEYCEIYKEKINPSKEVKIKPSLSFLKNKAKTLEDIYNNAKYIISDEIKFEAEDLKLVDEKAKSLLQFVLMVLEPLLVSPTLCLHSLPTGMFV